MAAAPAPPFPPLQVDFIKEGAAAVLPDGLSGPGYNVSIDDLFDVPQQKVAVKVKVTAA